MVEYLRGQRTKKLQPKLPKGGVKKCAESAENWGAFKMPPKEGEINISVKSPISRVYSDHPCGPGGCSSSGW